MPDRVTRFAADLLDAAAVKGARQSRSAKQQLDHWARVGRAVSSYHSGRGAGSKPPSPACCRWPSSRPTSVWSPTRRRMPRSPNDSTASITGTYSPEKG